MNAPAQPEKNEEGGMLVAALAGGAILLAIGLVMFSGGDEANEKDGDKIAAASSATGDKKSASGSASAFKKRDVDDASQGGRENTDEPKPQKALEKGPHRQSRQVGSGVASPGDAPAGPPEFETKEDELKWWNRQLDGAKMLETRRQQAIDKITEMETKAGNDITPEQQASYDKKREGLEEALQRSKEKVAEIEKKISEL